KASKHPDIIDRKRTFGKGHKRIIENRFFACPLIGLQVEGSPCRHKQFVYRKAMARCALQPEGIPIVVDQHIRSTNKKMMVNEFTLLVQKPHAMFVFSGVHRTTRYSRCAGSICPASADESALAVLIGPTARLSTCLPAHFPLATNPACQCWVDRPRNHIR